jgi:hypothetical protein
MQGLRGAMRLCRYLENQETYAVEVAAPGVPREPNVAIKVPKGIMHERRHASHAVVEPFLILIFFKTVNSLV